MTPPHIVWDWNGTLLDDVDAAVGALNHLLADRHLPPVTREFYRANFNFPAHDFYKCVGMDPDDDWDRLCIDFHTYVAAEPQQMRPDVPAALAYVRDRGARQSILSALHQDRLCRDTQPIAPFFTEIFGTDNLEGASKLDRGRELMARLGPVRTVFIGDTLHDAEVAAALGGEVVLVEGGHQTAERLRATGHPVAPTLLDAVRLILGA